MSRNPDIVFITEYMKNILYFAVVRQGKHLKNSHEAHYFCVDDLLLYENYFSDFGPLNLGCVYQYCKILNEKLKHNLNKQVIIHYTSVDPKKKANAAFLIACYGVLYFGLTPKDALKPLTLHGQTYRPFQDATQGDPIFTITLLDCINGIKKARDLGFFDFQDFNYDEYEKLDKIQGGDLNWIVPGKFLAFIGPVDYTVTLYHPPQMYIEYFTANGVKIVIRLNKKMYDANVFTAAGICHYDLFFPDGSCPGKRILLNFLRIAEEANCAIAVHCKAGLGRTGSLIGSYLIKHYRMTAHEAIGWMRICRPGSVIAHQQKWLEGIEPWLLKQGNIYRRYKYQDQNRLPVHRYGIYSISEKTMHRSPSPAFKKSGSPTSVLNKRPDSDAPVRPLAAKVRPAACKTTSKETADGCLRRFSGDNRTQAGKQEKRVLNVVSKGCESGEPRMPRSTSRSSGKTSPMKYRRANIQSPDPVEPSMGSGFKPTSALNSTGAYLPLTTLRLRSPPPLIKSVNDAKKYLVKYNAFNVAERDKQLNTAITVTPRHSYGVPNLTNQTEATNTKKYSQLAFNAASRGPTQPVCRRRLGRSPSPPGCRPTGQSQATNTVHEKILRESRAFPTQKENFIKLKSSYPREGSVGAASLGARREAPDAPRAPSVRSDERNMATQGDMLNSVKLHRRLRCTDVNTMFNKSFAARDKPVFSRINTPYKSGFSADSSAQNATVKERHSSPTAKSHSPVRPVSPKCRRNSPPFL